MLWNVIIIVFVIFIIVYYAPGLSVQEIACNVVEYVIVIVVIIILCCVPGLSVQEITHSVVEYIIIIIIIIVIIIIVITILCCVPGLSVQEMVHCAVEYGSPCEVDHVTFGEFCVLVDELRHKYETDSTASLPCAILPSKALGAGSSGRRKRKGGCLLELGNSLNTRTGLGNPS